MTATSGAPVVRSITGGLKVRLRGVEGRGRITPGRYNSILHVCTFEKLMAFALNRVVQFAMLLASREY